MKFNNIFRDWRIIILTGAFFLVSSNSSRAQNSCLKEIEQEIVQLVNKINPSIVTISAKYDYAIVDNNKNSFLQFKSEKRQPVEITNIGSGFIIDSTHILTKSNVIMGSKEITVIFYDSSTTTATFIGTDPELGLSVIKVNKNKFKPVKFENLKNLSQGCWVLLVGNSLGTTPSVSLGIVNSIRKNEMIQVSANVAAGNAGGAIFNINGNLVGLMTGMAENIAENNILGSTFFASQTTFAWPAGSISKSITEIMNRSKFPNGWIGVTGENWPGNIGGVHINSVTNNGPADKAGISVGDILLSINNKKIDHTVELANFIKFLHPGEKVDLQVLRGSGLQTVQVTIGEQPPQEAPSFYTSTPVEPLLPAMIEQAEYDPEDLSSDTNNKILLNRINELERELESMRVMIKNR
ncbi:MAG TPA: trypsin-like peptidase domain-containing protein [bacterium]|nr:trypsin-like peptidase domain-containing protein [bacterium]HPN44790.1 trypsin-like peptidase domain-containing protein [bacterium]